MADTTRRWWLISLVFVFVVVTNLPYIFAMHNPAEEYVFGGFLINPLDGNSYLAKIYEGWRGDWSFTLPYTAEKGNGAYINMLYVVLGHLSRVLGLTSLAIYHIARLLSSLLMLFALYRFIKFVIEDERVRLIAFSLVAFGSGLGWVALSFGAFTSDFWVAETYPFLSAFTNPHFPLGLALLLILLTFNSRAGLNDSPQVADRNSVFSILTAFLLAIVTPFGIVIALFVLGVLAVWETFPDLLSIQSSPVFRRALWIAIGGFPVLVYDYWVIMKDPLLSVWNAQNSTPSPLWWDFLISLSPALIVAIVGGYWLTRSNKLWGERLLIVWAATGLLLIYIPWGLQRRFMMGYEVPLVILAVFGLRAMSRARRRFIFLSALFAFLTIPTNLVVLLAARQAVESHDLRIFISKDEMLAFRWLQVNTAQDALVLASPDTGLLIPAYTGRRVIYGHPFETVDAPIKEKKVTDFFTNMSTVESSDLLNTVDYLFIGPRELRLGRLTVTNRLVISYQNPKVTIYRVVH